MDRIRRYGIGLLVTFIGAIIFGLIDGDSASELTNRLIFITLFALPIYMIIYGEEK